jgi:hypothetical protein
MISSETYTVAVFRGFQDLPETLPAAEADILTVVSDMVNPRGINSSRWLRPPSVNPPACCARPR